MNRGKQRSIPKIGGFTITETLIFLAVSSAMLFVAIGFVGGQQNKIQFVNSVRDFETRLTDIANDVATGYYIKPVNFTCEDNGTTLTLSPSATDKQGTNGDCVYIGTVVKLGDGGITNDESFLQYAVAGARTDASGENIANLAQSRPKAIYQNNLANAVTVKKIGYGTTVECVFVSPSTDCRVENTGNQAIGFFTTFASTAAGAQGGGIETTLVTYKTMSAADTRSGAANKINDPSQYTAASGNLNIPTTICLRSGSTKQYALIRLGEDNSSKINITSEIKNYSGSVPPCS